MANKVEKCLNPTQEMGFPYLARHSISLFLYAGSVATYDIQVQTFMHACIAWLTAMGKVFSGGFSCGYK